MPTDVVVASVDMIAARAVQPLIHAPLFRTYSSADPIGVQVGGAIKNVLASRPASATARLRRQRPRPPSSRAGSPR
jgi:glycerol-3-phosphate dehydrogenase